MTSDQYIKAMKDVFEVKPESFEIADAEIYFSDRSRSALEMEADTKIAEGPILVYLAMDSGQLVYELTAGIDPAADPYLDDDKMEAWLEGAITRNGEIIYAGVGEGS